MENIFIFHVRNIHVLVLKGLFILNNKAQSHYIKVHHVTYEN